MAQNQLWTSSNTAVDDGGLAHFLASGSVEMRFEGGRRVMMVFTALPGRTACAAMHDEDGVLWIACDDGKPWARGQAAQMLADGAPATCDEVINVIEAELRRIPTQGTRGRCRLALVR